MSEETPNNNNNDDKNDKEVNQLKQSADDEKSKLC